MPEPIDAPPLPDHRLGVLVVEDEALVAMDLADRLEGAGLAVFEARDAGEPDAPRFT